MLFGYRKDIDFLLSAIHTRSGQHDVVCLCRLSKTLHGDIPAVRAHNLNYIAISFYETHCFRNSTNICEIRPQKVRNACITLLTIRTYKYITCTTRRSFTYVHPHLVLASAPASDSGGHSGNVSVALHCRTPKSWAHSKKQIRPVSTAYTSKCSSMYIHYIYYSA